MEGDFGKICVIYVLLLIYNRTNTTQHTYSVVVCTHGSQIKAMYLSIINFTFLYIYKMSKKYVTKLIKNTNHFVNGFKLYNGVGHLCRPWVEKKPYVAKYCLFNFSINFIIKSPSQTISIFYKKINRPLKF